MNSLFHCSIYRFPASKLSLCVLSYLFCSLRKITTKNLPLVSCFDESKFSWQSTEIRLPYHLDSIYAKWMAITVLLLWTIVLVLNPLSKVAATFRGKMWQLFGCILKAEFSSKKHTFLSSPADFLLALALFYCYNIFDSYITCLTLSLNTVYVYFHSH